MYKKLISLVQRAGKNVAKSRNNALRHASVIATKNGNKLYGKSNTQLIKLNQARACSTNEGNSSGNVKESKTAPNKSGGNSLLYVLLLGGLGIGGYYYYNSCTVSHESQLNGAILGAIVGDAATVPLHWVYKMPDKPNPMPDIIKGKDDIAFLSESHSPFYRIDTGLQSCYGDEFIVALNSIEKDKGFNYKKWKQNIYDAFGSPDSVYVKAAKHEGYPRPGPWLHGTMRDFCKNYIKDKSGNTASNHKDLDQVCHAIPLCVYLNKTKQNDEFPVEKLSEILNAIVIEKEITTMSLFLLEILWNTLNGKNNIENIVNNILSNERYNNISDMIKDVINDFKNNKYNTIKDASLSYGQTCPIKNGIKVILYALLLNGDDYKKGILGIIESGGDNTSRALVYGSIVGSIYGDKCIPKEWINKAFNANDALKTWKSV